MVVGDASRHRIRLTGHPRACEIRVTRGIASHPGGRSRLVTTLPTFLWGVVTQGRAHMLCSPGCDHTTNGGCRFRVQSKRQRSAEWRQFPQKTIEFHTLPCYSESTEGGGIRTRAQDPPRNPAGFIQARSLLPTKKDPARTRRTSRPGGAAGPGTQKGPDDGPCPQAARPVICFRGAWTGETRR